MPLCQAAAAAAPTGSGGGGSGYGEYRRREDSSDATTRSKPQEAAALAIASSPTRTGSRRCSVSFLAGAQSAAATRKREGGALATAPFVLRCTDQDGEALLQDAAKNDPKKSMLVASVVDHPAATPRVPAKKALIVMKEK